MRLLVRDPHLVIAAAVEGDVDRVSERSHGVALPCFLNVTVTVETIVAARGVTPASWRRRGADASTLAEPAVRPLASDLAQPDQLTLLIGQ